MLPELNLPAIGATLAPFVGALPGSLITRTEVKVPIFQNLFPDLFEFIFVGICTLF